MKELVLHVRHLPDFKNAKTVVRPVEVRDYDGIECFVPIGDEFEMKRLPNDFFLREFMSLDHEDRQALLEFQNEYGLIESRFDRDADVLKSLFYALGANHPKLDIADEFEAASKTKAIRDKTILKLNEDKSFSTETVERLSCVCVDEVSACVKNMQVYIKALVEAAMNGVIEAEGNWNFILADAAVKYIRKYVDIGFPTIELTSASDAKYSGRNVPIMSMIAAQCLYGIQTKEHGDYVFKRCLHCGETFQFGRKSEEGDGLYKPRPAATPYCSPKCQKAYNKHKNNADGKRLY